MKPQELVTELISIREEKKLTLEDLSRKTTIRLEQLVKLENGDLNFLPPIYMHSLLKKYAIALGKDEKDLESLRSELGIAKELVILSSDAQNSSGSLGSNHSHSDSTGQSNSSDFNSISDVFKAYQVPILAIVIILVIGVSYGLYKVFASEKPDVVITRKTTPIVIEEQKRSDSSSQENVIEPPINSGAVTNPNTTKTIATNVKSTVKKHVLVVRAKVDSCWVSVLSDREGERKINLPPNQIARFTADSVFVLSVGRIESAEIQINGKPVTLPKSKGSIQNVKLVPKL